MMAAEVSSEDTGSVATGTGVAGGGPETAPFPYYPKSRMRVTDLGQGAAPTLRQHSNTSPDSLPDMSMIYPVSSGDVTGSVLSATGSGGAGGGHSVFQGTSSGTVGGMCCSPTSEGPASRISPTSTGPDGPTVFPPLPPPPPPPPSSGGLGGTMDESDMQDGQEYEEEEVVFPLSAPPTNQWVCHCRNLGVVHWYLEVNIFQASCALCWVHFLPAVRQLRSEFGFMLTRAGHTVTCATHN